MYVSDALRLILRRYLIVALGLMLTLGAAAASMSMVSTQYQATGEVLLLPPSAPFEPDEPTNPYLSLPSSLVFTSSLVASAVSSIDAAEQMEGDGFLSTYAVAVVPGTGPLIAISVKSTDPAAATVTRDELIARLDAHLMGIQDVENVSDGQYIVARVVSSPSRAEVVAGARIRAAATVVAIGIALTLFAAFGRDRWKASRRRPVSDMMPVYDDVGGSDTVSLIGERRPQGQRKSSLPQ